MSITLATPKNITCNHDNCVICENGCKIHETTDEGYRKFYGTFVGDITCEDDIDIIRYECNRWYDLFLLEYQEIDQEIYNSIGSSDYNPGTCWFFDDIQNKCGCDGWFYDQTRCVCGSHKFYYYVEDSWYANANYFDINSRNPCGYPMLY